MEYQIQTLPNGIRLVHCQTDGPVAYCGLIVNTGSRDELRNEHGLAHFIEHAVFKGTTRRRSYHILNRLESVGGDINAYTTKEETCIHTAFLNNEYERAIELLSDMMFNSNFPAHEIEKEKDVIIDEINSYKDNPSELIFDEFEDLMFKNLSLGRNILGEPKKIKSYTRIHLLRFKEKNYSTNQFVIFSLGKIDFKKLSRIVNLYFADKPAKPADSRKKENPQYTPFSITRRKNTYQLHCIIGNLAYNYYDDKRITLGLLNNLLGGNSMNSRLSMALREKSGIAYDIESNYTGYSDNGIFSLYFGTEKDKLDKSLRLIKKEFNKLKYNKLGVQQLHRAKQQLIGQIAIGAENKENLSLNLGKSLLLFDKIDDYTEINRRILEVTASEILDVANEILDEEKLSMLIYE
ncbi:MAG: pitrilysin family protein [Bacteroidales bacterium]